MKRGPDHEGTLKTQVVESFRGCAMLSNCVIEGHNVILSGLLPL